MIDQSIILRFSMKFRIGELFSGPGGIGYAAKVAKATADNGEEFSIKHAWATNYDKDTFAHNICNGKNESVVCKDIRKLYFNKLQNISDIDGLAFGFPCYDFSMVGEQKGINGTFGSL